MSVLTDVQFLIQALNIEAKNFSLEYLYAQVEKLTCWELKIHRLDIDVDGVFIKEESTRTNHIIINPAGGFKERHTLFHEIGHIVFGHQTVSIDELTQVKVLEGALCRKVGHLRESKAEVEAEAFATKMDAIYRQSRISNASTVLGNLL